MSKKIWRGYYNGRQQKDKIATSYNTWGITRTDCTVVPDSACFPVKEAMAFMRARERCDIDAIIETDSKYFAAVERMKKKAKKP